MTDREALEFISDCTTCRAYFYCNNKSPCFIAHEIAKAALQERIDREDTCEFCSRLEYDYVLVPYNEVEILGSGSGEKKYRKIKIIRCPKCGRQLKGVSNE